MLVDFGQYPFAADSNVYQRLRCRDQQHPAVARSYCLADK